jgi:hypothetical protein
MYSKSLTISKSLRAMATAVASVITSLLSLWVAHKLRIEIDPETKGHVVFIISMTFIGIIEGLRNYIKHRRDSK